MTKHLTLVINLDDPEILDSILKLLEPFQQEISVSVRDNIVTAHVIGGLGPNEHLDLAMTRASERGVIIVCAGNFHPPKRGDLAEMFTDKLKEMNKSIEITARAILNEPEELKKDASINKQQLKRWGSKQTSNYKSKIPNRKFISRVRKH